MWVYGTCVCAQWRPNECIRSHGVGVTGAKSRTQVLWERGVSPLNYKVFSPATQAIKDTHNYKNKGAVLTPKCRAKDFAVQLMNSWVRLECCFSVHSERGIWRVYNWGLATVYTLVLRHLIKNRQEEAIWREGRAMLNQKQSCLLPSSWNGCEDAQQLRKKPPGSSDWCSYQGISALWGIWNQGTLV